MDPNYIENFECTLNKFNKYTIIKLDAKEYITADTNAGLTTFNPFEHLDTILTDILLIGKYIKDNRTEEINELIINFANSYGLLGELINLPLNQNFFKEDTVYLPSSNIITDKEVLPIEEYLKLFLQNEKQNTIEILKKHDGTIDIKIEEELSPIIFDENHIPDENTIICTKAYCECLVWFKHYAHNLYLTFEALEKYHSTEDEYTKEVYRKQIDIYNSTNISINLLPTNYEYPIALKWNFTSLKQAIDTIFGLTMCNTRKYLRMCKHCSKPFYSTNLKSEYCSSKCRNQANVYKSRAKYKDGSIVVKMPPNLTN